MKIYGWYLPREEDKNTILPESQIDLFIKTNSRRMGALVLKNQPLIKIVSLAYTREELPSFDYIPGDMPISLENPKTGAMVEVSDCFVYQPPILLSTLLDQDAPDDNLPADRMCYTYLWWLILIGLRKRVIYLRNFYTSELVDWADIATYEHQANPPFWLDILRNQIRGVAASDADPVLKAVTIDSLIITTITSASITQASEFAPEESLADPVVIADIVRSKRAENPIFTAAFN